MAKKKSKNTRKNKGSGGGKPKRAAAASPTSVASSPPASCSSGNDNNNAASASEGATPTMPPQLEDFSVKFADTLAMLHDLRAAGRMSDAECGGAVRSLYDGSATEEDVLTAWAPFALKLPARVELVGLAARADLNGRTGEAVAWMGSAKRFEVQLDADGGGIEEGETVRVRPANLQSLNRARATPSAKISRGILHDGGAWTSARLQCRQRLPVRGEVTCMLDASGEENTDPGSLSGSSRDGSMMVFTVRNYEGYVHRFHPSTVSGISTYVPARTTSQGPIKLEPSLVVRKAFHLKGQNQDRILTVSEDEDMPACAGSAFFLLYDLPNFDVANMWRNAGLDRGARDMFSPFMTELLDCFENTLAAMFWTGDKITRLSAYTYSESNADLRRVSSWQINEAVVGRISSVCVVAGGSSASLVTMSFDGTLRLWRTDSAASGCVAVFNAPKPVMDSPFGIGLVSRVPKMMQSELNGLATIASIHQGTLSLWSVSSMSLGEIKRSRAIHNPGAEQNYLSPGSLIMDSGLDYGPIVQVGNLPDEDETSQIIVWDPWREFISVAFEIPSERYLSSYTATFSCGKLLIACGLEERDSHGEFGEETCYVYVVSGRENTSAVVPAQIGIDSGNVPGAFENLLADPCGCDIMAWYNGLPPGLNMSLGPYHMDKDAVVSPPAIRTCQYRCHGCDSFFDRRNLSPCANCGNAWNCLTCNGRPVPNTRVRDKVCSG